MLIDINTHVGHWPFRKLRNNTCNARLQAMNNHGIAISVVSNLNGLFYKNVQSANDELYQELKSDKLFHNRFIPIATINPLYAGWQNDLRDSVKMGMKGVRLYPDYHGYKLEDYACIELIKQARDLGLIVSFALRIVDSRVSSWLDINEEYSLKDIVPVIEKVPDAKYLIVNIVNGTQLTDEQAALIRKSNILMDTSGASMNNLGALIKKCGNQKFGFGTHSPVLDHRTGLLRIESLRTDEADEKTKERLRSGNAKEFFRV
jgi:predicted TIM-barrel fold metal-dependent hydrolase